MARRDRRITISRLVLAAASLFLPAARAWPCQIEKKVPPETLVAEAEVIVRARTMELAQLPGREGPPGSLGASPTQVRFIVLEVLKGDFSAQSIEFNGSLTGGDARNSGPVPYEFMRQAESAGRCFALAYRSGAEYLLLLKRTRHQAYAQPDDLTPYWSPLAPTNEALPGGARDPWVVWVRRALIR